MLLAAVLLATVDDDVAAWIDSTSCSCRVSYFKLDRNTRARTQAPSPPSLRAGSWSFARLYAYPEPSRRSAGFMGQGCSGECRRLSKPIRQPLLGETVQARPAAISVDQLPRATPTGEAVV